jgi:conjugal transfer pilus assembly protein TraB
MNDISPSRSVLRRQYLVLAGVGSVIAGSAAIAVYLGSTGHGDRPPPSKPVTTSILAPGAQVDPRDAWRGQADAQLKALEDSSRETGRRSGEVEARSKELQERLDKLERLGLTPLPPPPVAVPPLRPVFGPDRPATTSGDLPPPLRGGGASRPAGPEVFPAQAPAQPPVPQGIVSIVLADAPVQKGATSPSAGSSVPRDTRRYLPSGTFTRAVMLAGLDAPTGGQAQRNPQPVLLRLADLAVLPNRFRANVKECFVVGAGYGDVSSERAYIRTEALSCVTRDGRALDIPVKGYVAGEDGKAGMRGRLVSKQGQILANALLAGVASGIGHAFQMNATTLSVSPLGATGTVDPDKQLQAGLGTGVGKALDRLAQYYISLADKVFPVIEVDAGRTVDVVITQGVALQGAREPSSADEDLAPLPGRPTSQDRIEDDEDE